ncbi:hypothetical protein GCM10010260_15150 [Streptomyces filipinensis]|uniref:HTH cro/C1-type domain-containing protein n=1 Tax=Streptomyces filipinensis TaxID=66887 RepID=A0A918I962_9ACTN|nr:XRE family transcriptional regulator [Streptomyces filipinensis]GGU83391.1 hypothetical protein GCM10010260_15150 [Streptomyces filipinensis]
MPRWKDLPEELDPQIKEFTSQVRRLVDRSGLSVAALADRTGYSKTSWERYLGGRLLAPKGAVVALAEVTGTNPVHLTTMWELAERAWSRAEMRHDRTMEAIRISQARAALGDFGAAEATGGPSGRKADRARPVTGITGPALGIAGPAGVSPTIPPQPTAPDADAREGTGRGPADGDGGGRGPVDGDGGGRGPVDGDGAGRGPVDRDASDAGSGADVQDRVGRGAADRDGTGRAGSSGGNSWNLAGYQGPSRASVRPGSGAGAGAGAADANGSRPAAPPGGSGWTRNTPNPYDELQPQPPAPRPGGGAPAPGGAGRQRVIMFVAGLVGVLVVIGAVFFLTDRGAKHGTAAKRPSPSATSHVSTPPGVKCAGSACDGKDAEAMGCSGDLVTTARTVTIGTTTLEVRYSKACGTAWGRITGAAQGDRVQITAGKARQTGETTTVGDTIAYTPMVAVKNAAAAKACATLASGRTGCTK